MLAIYQVNNIYLPSKKKVGMGTLGQGLTTKIPLFPQWDSGRVLSVQFTKNTVNTGYIKFKIEPVTV